MGDVAHDGVLHGRYGPHPHVMRPAVSRYIHLDAPHVLHYNQPLRLSLIPVGISPSTAPTARVRRFDTARVHSAYFGKHAASANGENDISRDALIVQKERHKQVILWMMHLTCTP